MRNKITVGASTGCFFDICSTELSLEKIKEMGFTFAEIFLQANAELSPSYVKKLSDCVKQLQLPVLSIHPIIPQFEHFLYSDYIRQKEESLDKFKRYLEICSFLNAQYFVLHMVNNGQENSSENIIDKINILAEIAVSYNVTIGIENCPYGVFNKINNIKKYLPFLNNNIRLILDFKSVWKVQENLLETLHAMSERYCYSHLSSYNNDRLFGTNFTDLNKDIIDFLKEINENPRYFERKKIILETFWAKDSSIIDESLSTLIKFLDKKGV